MQIIIDNCIHSKSPKAIKLTFKALQFQLRFKFPNELLETLNKKNSINKQVDIEFQQANIPGHANPRYPRLGNIFPGGYQSAFSNKCQKFYDFAGPQPDLGEPILNGHHLDSAIPCRESEERRETESNAETPSRRICIWE